jgi:hypothetical protein
MPLSEGERLELRRLGLKEEYFFDAQGRSVPACKNEMRQKRLYFAFNTTPCRREEHTLRTINNHCIICNPQAMARYVKRIMDGYIYIAASERGKLFKVGVTRDIEQRRKSLRSRRYAGQWDWEILWSNWDESPGRLEEAIHSQLISFCAPGLTTRNLDKTEQSTEVFRCNWIELLTVIKRVSPDANPRLPKSRIETEFNFRDIAVNG